MVVVTLSDDQMLVVSSRANVVWTLEKKLISPSLTEIKLDPDEHQAYRWASEEEISNAEVGKGDLRMVSEDQKRTILQAFQLHNQVA